MPRALKATDSAIDLLVAFLIVFPPLAFGAVHTWAYTMMEMASMLLLVVWAFRWAFIVPPDSGRDLLPVYACLILFICYALFQTLPIGVATLELLSPMAHELYGIVLQGYGDTAQASHMPLSLTPHLTRLALAKLVAYASVFIVLTSHYRTRGGVQRVLFLLAVTGFVESLYGLQGYFNKTLDILGYHRAGAAYMANGTFINRNHYAGYLGMTFLACTGLLLARLTPGVRHAYGLRHRLTSLLRSHGTVANSLLILMVITMALGIVFSLSRAGILSLALCILAILLTILLKRRRLHTVLLSLVLLGVIAASLLYGTTPAQKRYAQALDDLTRYRMPTWQATLKMSRDYPLTGTGLGTFSNAFAKYTPAGATTRYAQAHNDYLQLLSDTGSAGALMALSASILFATAIIRRWRMTTEPFSQWVALGGTGAIAYMMLHSAADFNLQIPSNAMTFTIICALTYSSLVSGGNTGGDRKDDTKDDALAPHIDFLAPRTLAFFMLLPVVGMLSAFSISWWKAEMAYPVERSFIRDRAVDDLSDPAVEERLIKAITLSPGSSRHHALLAKHYMAMASTGALNRNKQGRLMEKAKTKYLDALSLNPAGHRMLGQLAWADFSMGDHARAIRWLDTSIKAAPGDYYTHIFYAISTTRFLNTIPKGLRKIFLHRAQREFETGIALNPSFASAPKVLASMAEAYLMEGDTESAMEQLGKIRTLDSRTAPYHARHASLLIRSGRLRQGINKYAWMLKKGRLNQPGRAMALASLHDDALADPAQTEVGYMLASQYLADNHYSEALVIMDAVIQAIPPDAKAFYLRGRAHEGLAMTGLAVDDYTKALALNKGYRRASRRLLHLLRQEEGK